MNTEQYTKISKITIEMLENAHSNHSHSCHQKQLTELEQSRQANEHKDDLDWGWGSSFEQEIQRLKDGADAAFNKLMSIRKITLYLIDNFIHASDDTFVPEVSKDEFDVVLEELNKRAKDTYYDMYAEDVELAKIVAESEINKKYGGHGKEGLINLKQEHLNARKREYNDMVELANFWKTSFKVNCPT